MLRGLVILRIVTHLLPIVCFLVVLLCDVLAQGLIGLIGYSYQQVATSFLGTHSKGTLG
jgi:hypothetical protein